MSCHIRLSLQYSAARLVVTSPRLIILKRPRIRLYHAKTDYIRNNELRDHASVSTQASEDRRRPRVVTLAR